MAAFAVIISDQALKFLVTEGIFGIKYVSNTGVAFGLLQGSNLIWGMASAAVAALIIFCRKRASGSLESAAMALILGGALSNLIDRVLRGAVIDYIAVKGMPVFNLADAALTTGAALVIASLIVNNFRK